MGLYQLPAARALASIPAGSISILLGDVVLDPFMGSGALLVGARERGATVIGCDIAPAALRLAKTKLVTSGGIGEPRPSSSAHRTGRPRTRPKREPPDGR